MPIQIVVAAAAVVVSIPLLIWGVSTGRGKREAVSRNLGTTSTVTDRRALQLQERGFDRAVLPAVRILAQRMRRLTPAGWLASLEHRARLAGPRSGWTADRALAAKVVLGALGLLLAIWAAPQVPGRIGVLLLILGPVLGYFLPDVLLRERARERQQRIGVELPDTLDQVTISVEAGLGFDAALAYVAETGTGPLADELRIMLHQVALGVPRQQALRDLVDRTDVPELRHFVFAIRQAEEYGLPIAHVLRVQSGVPACAVHLPDAVHRLARSGCDPDR
jgi:tight adherence protein C